MRARIALPALSLCFAALASCSGPSPTPSANVIFLVRHAERAEDGTSDPHISEAGRARAQLLARMLRDAGIEHIYSTDFARTRETAAPLSAELGVNVEIYDPTDLTAFANQLRSTPGRALVVGHSDTTPDLVEALGGDPGPAYELMEYDRLYVLSLVSANVHTVLLRFGDPGPA